MGAPLCGTERRAERCRGRGRSRRRGDGHHRLRAQPGERAEGVEPTPGRPGRAVRRHRARRRSRPRLRQHGGVPARRPRRRSTRSTSARVASAGSSRRSPSRGRPRRPAAGGAWNPVSVDAEGRVYAGISNPGPWGGSKARPNGGAFRGRDALHRLARRARREDRQAALVRPGRPPRRPRLRLPRHADPRARRRPRAGVRGGEGRSRRGVGQVDAPARLVARRRDAPQRRRAAAASADARVPRPLRRAC